MYNNKENVKEIIISRKFPLISERWEWLVLIAEAKQIQPLRGICVKRATPMRRLSGLAETTKFPDLDKLMLMGTENGRHSYNENVDQKDVHHFLQPNQSLIQHNGLKHLIILFTILPEQQFWLDYPNVFMSFHCELALFLQIDWLSARMMMASGL